MRQDLQFAFRILARSPGWTAVAVLSLALGIGANTLAFSLVESVLLRPFPYRDPERLVLLWASKSEGTTRGIAGPDLQDCRDQNHTFEDIDAFLGNIRFSLGSEPSDTVPGATLGRDRDRFDHVRWRPDPSVRRSAGRVSPSPPPRAPLRPCRTVQRMDVPDVLPVGLSHEIAPLGYGGRLTWSAARERSTHQSAM